MLYVFINICNAMEIVMTLGTSGIQTLMLRCCNF